MKTKHILGLLEEYGLRLWPRAHKSRFINSLTVGSVFPPQVPCGSWKASYQFIVELAHATRSAEEISYSRVKASKRLVLQKGMTIHWAQVVQPAQELSSFCSTALQRFPSSKGLEKGQKLLVLRPIIITAKLHHVKIFGFYQFFPFFFTHMLLPPE